MDGWMDGWMDIVQELKTAFIPHQTHVVKDAIKHQSRGYGFVNFPQRRPAEMALIWWATITLFEELSNFRYLH